jgi:hypothetical protein
MAASSNWDFERNMLTPLQRACAQARELSLQPDGLATIEVQRLSRPDGYLSASTERGIDWRWLLGKLAKEPGLWDELASVAGNLKKGDLIEVMISDPHWPEAPADRIWFYFLAPTLKLYRAAQEDWEWDEELAMHSLSECRAAQESRAVGNLQTFAPLAYFDGPEQAIELEDGLVIRPLTDDAREDLWHTYGEDSLSLLVLDGWSHMIDHRWRISENDDDPALSHGAGGDAIEDVIRALRLHHPGIARAAIICTRTNPPSEPGDFIHHVLTSTPADVSYDRDTVEGAIVGHRIPVRTQVEAGEDKALTALLNGLRAAQEDRRLALALRRFDTSYERDECEDSLIDLWIAFEALVLPEGGSELSYRAALRIAQLAGDDKDTRREAFEQARRSYKCRSQIVHGETVKSNLGKVFEQTQELARKVLRAWILDPPKDGVDQIDRSLFG